MKPNLTIAQLVAEPTFGVNLVRKFSLEAVAASTVTKVDMIRGGRAMRVRLLRPNPANEEIGLTQNYELTRTAANEAFFAKTEKAGFMVHGELDAVAFLAAFLPPFTTEHSAKLSYGATPEITRVIRGANGISQIYFTSVKEGKVRNHAATRRLIDIEAELNHLILVPSSLFKTYNQFIKLVATKLDVDEDRIFTKEDPLDYNNRQMRLHISTQDLTYFGSLPLNITNSGTAVQIIDRVTGEPVVEAPVDPVDPVDPPIEPPVVTPVVFTNLAYDPVTQTLTVNVNQQADVVITTDTGVTATVPSVDGLVSYLFVPELVGGTIITVAVGAVSDIVEVPMPPAPPVVVTITDVVYTEATATVTANVANSETANVTVGALAPVAVPVVAGVLTYVIAAPVDAEVIVVSVGEVSAQTVVVVTPPPAG